MTIHLLLLAGCIMVGTRYKSPTEGYLASVSFTTSNKNPSHIIDVVRYTGEEYLESKGQVIAWLGVNEPWYKGDLIAIKAKADEEFRFSYRVSYYGGTHQNEEKAVVTSTIYCINHLSFTPRAEKKYLVTHGLGSNNTCWVKVDIENENGSKQPEASAKLLKSCIDIPDSAFNLSAKDRCTENFKFRE